MIMPPPGMFPPRRPTQAELALERKQEQGQKFWNALIKFQVKPKRKKK